MSQARTARIISISACTVLLCTLALAADQKSPTKLSDLPPEAQQAISAVLARHPAGIQDFTLTASGGLDGDNFGASVAIDGNTVVVGAPSANAAYVFVKPPSGWANMTETAELTQFYSQGGYFGGSVAISGRTIVVGAFEANVGGNEAQGAAYVFVEPVGGWSNMTETAELSASDGVPYSAFGAAVGISDNTVVVGAPFGNNGTFGPGIIYEFTEPGSGWANMTQTAELTTSNGYQNDDLGTAVSISGNTIIASTCGCGSPGPLGAAYVFVEPSTGWTDVTQTATLTASDGAAGDGFGTSLSASGATVVVSAPSQAGVGAVYVFVQPRDGWVNTTQTAELTAGGGPPGFGDAVGISGGVIVAGNPVINRGNGRAFVFLKPAGGWHNASKYKVGLGISFLYRGNAFGGTVAVSGTTAVIGARAAPTSPPCTNDRCEVGPGEAFVFVEQ